MEKETEKGLAEEGLIEPGELVLGVPVESVSRKRMRSPLSDVFLEKSINVCCFPCCCSPSSCSTETSKNEKESSFNIHSHNFRTEETFGEHLTWLPHFVTEVHRTKEGKWFVHVLLVTKLGQKSGILNF